MTKKQISALIEVVRSSRDLSELSKKLLILLIKKTDRFRRQVHITLSEVDSGFSAEEIRDIANSTSCSTSSNRVTHLNELLQIAGTKMRFSFHYGHFVDGRFITAGQFAGFPEERVADKDTILEGQPLRYTFWMAHKPYSADSVEVVVSREEINSIDPKFSELYPFLNEKPKD